MYLTTKLTILALAASASAQVTTSVWMIGWGYGTDKIGWLASIVDVKNGHTTMAITPDNGTDQVALGLMSTAQTITVAPDYYEVSAERNFGGRGDATGDANVLKYACTKTASDQVDAACMISYGANYGSIIQCGQPRTRNGTSYDYYTRTHTYPPRGSQSGGVETLTATFTIRPVSSRTRPAWCTESGSDSEIGRTSTTLSTFQDIFSTYQVIVTAGMEKMSATTGAGPSGSSATPTSTPTDSSQSTPAGNENAARPTKGAGSLMAGLAIAAYFI